VPEVTDGTVFSIGLENPLPEDHLMHTLSRLPRHVPSSDIRFGIIDRIRNRSPKLLVINGDVERESGRIVSSYEHGPRRDVQPRDNTVEVHQRRASSHGGPEASVLVMLRVRPPIAVPEQPAGWGVPRKVCWYSSHEPYLQEGQSIVWRAGLPTELRTSLSDDERSRLRCRKGGGKGSSLQVGLDILGHETYHGQDLSHGHERHS
jgi:hypothetical protein